MIFCKKCWTENQIIFYWMEVGREVFDIDLEKDIRTLLEDLKSTDPDVRMKASNKLSIYLNPNSQRYPNDLVNTLVLKLGVDPIVETLKNADRRSKVSMAWCLGYLNNEISVKPLISSLSDEEVVGACILNLIKLKRYSTEPLIDILSSEDDKMLNAAAESLGEIGDESAVEPLLNLLTSNSMTMYTFQMHYLKLNLKKPLNR